MRLVDRPRPVRRSPAFALAGGVVVVLCASLGLAPAGATAADYPTWDQVRAAQGDAAATQAQVDTISATLDGLEATAAARGRDAVTAQLADTQAQAALADATQQADLLEARATEAEKTADEARTAAGQLAAQLFRVGNGPSLTAGLLGSDDPDDTLYQLGTAAQLGDRWNGVLADATVSSKTVGALRDQAATARDERDRLATEAATAASSAAAAQTAAETEAADVTTRSADLYAQLAALKNTSAELEQQYRQGVAADQAYRAQQAAAAAAATAARPTAGTGTAPVAPAPSSRATGGGTPTAPGGTTTPTPPPVSVVNDPAGAKAYAASVVASRGWSADENTCLVQLWNKESGWRTNATNPSSKAYGIPQALPGEKMASSGLDWLTSYRTQVNWGLGYITSRYGTPCVAWAHSVATNWY